MNKLYLYLFIILFLIFACNNKPIKKQKYNERKADISKIKQMEWIIGKWESISDNGILYEIWIKINDSTYSGKNYMISNKDTVFSETISLELKNNDLFYIPTVNYQNNNLPIPFKCITSKGGEIIFENKEHDFPQRIIYKNPKPDSLYAKIEGYNNGKYREEVFLMKRCK